MVNLFIQQKQFQPKTITIKHQMKQQIMNFFRDFDLFSAPASLRILNKNVMKSSLLGLLSLIIFAGLIYILVINSLQAVRYQQISYTYEQNIIPGSQANGQIRMFGISFAWVPNSQFDTQFQFFINYFVEGQLKQVIKLTPCKAQQWADLGQRYNQTFYSYEIVNMYCPNITKPYTISQTLSQNKPTYATITLKICNPQSQQFCDPAAARDYILHIVTTNIWLYILDIAIHPNNKQIFTYKISRVNMNGVVMQELQNKEKQT